MYPSADCHSKIFEYQVSILKSTRDHCFFAACLARRYHVVCVQHTCHSGYDPLYLLQSALVVCVLCPALCLVGSTF